MYCNFEDVDHRVGNRLSTDTSETKLCNVIFFQSRNPNCSHEIKDGNWAGCPTGCLNPTKFGPLFWWFLNLGLAQDGPNKFDLGLDLNKPPIGCPAGGPGAWTYPNPHRTASGQLRTLWTNNRQPPTHVDPALAQQRTGTAKTRYRPAKCPWAAWIPSWIMACGQPNI
jgi:hypothetical protein